MPGGTRSARSGERPNRRWPAAVAGAALAAAVFATAGYAQLGDVGETTGVDTDYTPRAKESERWEWVAGARYGGGVAKPSDVPAGSVTPFDLDFFAVAFRDPRNGFAGGAECAEEVEGEAAAEVRACERVPVIWQYTVDELGEGSWREAFRGEGRGYVGAITWLGDGRALAVGGDGCYPRREVPCPDGLTEAGADPAGGGRAWLYDEGGWRELAVPAGMRGLTAADTSPRKADCGEGTAGECAAVGGLRQLWTFRDGEFDRGWSSDGSAGEAVERGEIFLFRVRDLQFVPNPPPDLPPRLVEPIPQPGEGTYAVAVTGGCCAADEKLNGPRALVFDGLTWHARQVSGLNASDWFHGESQRRPLGEGLDSIERNWDADEPGWGRQGIERACPGLPFVPCLRDTYQEGWSPFGIPVVPPLEDGTGEPWPVDLPDDLPRAPGEDVVDPSYQDANRELDAATTPYGASVQFPDSYYTTWDVRGGELNGNVSTGAQFKVMATPGAPSPAALADGLTAAHEPASQVAQLSASRQRGTTGGFSISLQQSNQERLLSTLRLVSAEKTPVGVGSQCCGFNAPPSEPQPNFFESVGVLRSTGQGVAFGPWSRKPKRDHQTLHGCDTAPDGTPVVPPENCDPDAERFAKEYGTFRVFKLDAYALNAVDVMDDPLDNGAGWAVGDHGAIQGLGAETAAQAQAHEPPPAHVGTPAQGKLPDRSPYDGFREPLTAEPGTVPPLGATPDLERFDTPRFTAAGDAVTEMAFSGDGSEGWGIDSDTDTVARFDGLVWHTCRRGETIFEAACPGLGPLASGDVMVEELVRIPLERDRDPENDDELEVLAFVGGKALVYRDGRWDHEDGALVTGIPSGISSAAFVAPDDGWAVQTNNTTSIVHRFDGSGWVACKPGFQSPVPAQCADPEGRLDLHVEQQGTTFGQGAADGIRVASVGERVYLYGTGRVPASIANNTGIDPVYPLIIYRDPGGTWRGSADGSDGGLDPGFYAEGGEDEPFLTAPDVNPTADNLLNLVEGSVNPLAAIASYELERQLGEGEAEGRVYALGVAPGEDGELEGWAAGEFGGKGTEAKAVMLRLEDGQWRVWSRPDASEDYLHFAVPARGLSMVALEEPVGAHDAFLLGPVPLAFNVLRERWEVMELPFQTRQGKRPHAVPHWGGAVRAIVSNAAGGLWLAGSGGLYRYGVEAPRPVFREVASPVPPGLEITASTAGGDGSFWLATNSNVLYRHDREVGWDRVAVPGWDAGSVVTNPAGVSALAVGADGRGVAVGPQGRIARIGPDGARLDRAAGTACELGAPRPPCGTGRDLRSAAVAPDGSALVGGKALSSLLWRPAGGEFRVIEAPPRQPSTASVAGLFMPTDDSAYLLLDNGRVFRGERTAAGYDWQLQPGGGTEPAEAAEEYATLGGRALERVAEGIWRPAELELPGMSVIAAPPGGGPGLIAGGEDGLIMTLQRGALRVARPSDRYAPLKGPKYGTHQVTELAAIPGGRPREVEAWAVVQDTGSRFGFGRPGPAHVLLHYASDPSLDLVHGVEPLPDAPPERLGEITFAAFGKQDCQKPELDCFEQSGRRTHAVIRNRITEEITARARRTDGGMFALHTGDGVDSPTPERAFSGSFMLGSAFGSGSTLQTPANRDRKVGRFVEHTADRLTDAGVPLLGALGRQDLATQQVEACPGQYGCAGDWGAGTWFWSGFRIRSSGNGANVQWRQATAIGPAPWERPGGIDAGGLRLERVGDALSLESPQGSVPDPRDDGEPLTLRPPSAVTWRIGAEGLPELRAEAKRGGSTHYAFDLARDGRKIARVVVLDTSLRSLRASDAIGEPQSAGGQLAWLDRMLCLDGGVDDTGGPGRDCTREPGQQAIVVSNTPTYTYAPIEPTELQTDAAELEAVLIRHRVNMVVSGRLGWMGRYWALAPGVHEPCPGQGYRDQPPEPGSRVCGEGGGESDQLHDGAKQLSSALEDAGAPQLPDESNPLGQLEEAGWPLPFVVSSTAGGEFAPAGQNGGSGADDGFWRGYAVVRLDASGDPRKTVVEMRPVFDWIAIRAQERTLRPGQRMTLRGYGREAYGQETPIREYRIDSAAITHRYDLLLADPADPARPLRDANGDYIPVPAQVATMDRQTGRLHARRGRSERTYAVGLLSVGEHVAAYPLVFEPRRSFRPARAKVQLPPLPRIARAPAAQPPIRIADPLPPPPAAPPAGPASPLASQTLQPPQPPALPTLPALNATAPPPAPTPPGVAPPPPPPAPPSVPPQQQAQPLALGGKLQPVSIVPSVNPPAPPPVNPAPPAGSAARKEAKQRQAATAKSEEGAEKARAADVDLAQDSSVPHGAQMTRRDRVKPGASFTPFAPTAQPSSWVIGVTWGGGAGLLAFALATGFAAGRARPGRRPPELPAPARCVASGRRPRADGDCR